MESIHYANMWRYNKADEPFQVLVIRPGTRLGHGMPDPNPTRSGFVWHGITRGFYVQYLIHISFRLAVSYYGNLIWYDSCFVPRPRASVVLNNSHGSMTGVLPNGRTPVLLGLLAQCLMSVE